MRVTSKVSFYRWMPERAPHPGLLYRLSPAGDPDDGGSAERPFDPVPARREDLPYRIELWDGTKRDRIERVLARAFNAPLARAIFKAAQSEHPERRITLRRGGKIIADSVD